MESRDGHVKCDVIAFATVVCKSCMFVESSHAHKCYVTAAGYKSCMFVESSHAHKCYVTAVATSHACLWSQIMDRSAMSQLQSCMEV